MCPKEAELEAEERRVANFVQFIGDGRGGLALAEALGVSERKRDELRAELELLRRSREAVSSVPPLIWMQERVTTLQESWNDVRNVLRCCSERS